MESTLHDKAQDALRIICAALSKEDTARLNTHIFAVQVAVNQLQATEANYREIISKIDWHRRELASYSSRITEQLKESGE